MYIENHTKHWIFDNSTPSNYFNLQSVLCTSYIWFLILPGEHNATYTVAPSQEGLKFTKVRHGHPVQYARANYSKVTLDQPDCRQSEHGFSGHRHFGQPNRKVTRGQLNFQKSLGL